MSVVDFFISSSLRTARMDSYQLSSSSPELPSLTDIFAKNSAKPSLRSGSDLVPVPTKTLTAFTNATNLIGDVPELNIDVEQTRRSPILGLNIVNALIRGCSPEAPTSAQQETPILVESSPTEEPWQRSKTKTPTPEPRQPPMPKDKVTKIVAKEKPGEKATRSCATTETVSKHFMPKTGKSKAAQIQDQEPMEWDNYESDLPPNELAVTAQSCSEPALQRRVDWTPPPANNTIFIASDSDNQELLSSDRREKASKEVFQTLFENYACTDDSASISSGRQHQPEVLKKRKRIDLLSTTGKQAEEFRAKEISPSKPAPAKRKARTITELATAPYAVPVAPEPEFDLETRSTRDSLLDYFDSGGEVKALVEHQSVVMSKNKQGSKPSKAKAKPRKKKGGSAEAPILLSPNSALKLSSNQDFVFGTSSQLVGEESPATLRELQLAIQASNRDDDPFGESDSQGLWHASARDNDGELMDVIDLVQTPIPPNKNQRLTTRGRKELHLSNQPQSDDFVDIDTIALDTPRAENATPSQHNPHFFPTQTVPPPALSVVNDPATTYTDFSDTSIPRPKYETFTDSQLSKHLASYGFKPVKKRQAMIALLDQCWASKNPGGNSVQARPISTTAALTSPKRTGKAKAPPQPPAAGAGAGASEKPAGRPRARLPKKVTEATSTTSSDPPTVSVVAKSKSKKTSASSPAKEPRGRAKQPARSKREEIADSENSDPEDEGDRGSPSLSPSSPEPFDDASDTAAAIAAGDEEEETDLLLTTPADERQVALFGYITRAVAGQPRSRDPACPSWHERMLLYDPVVIEDLTAWLNEGNDGGALARAGYGGGEVTPADVKRWCEARGVVCLWRNNRRGKERKRS